MKSLSYFFKCLPGLAGIFSILLGLTVIWGWYSGNSILTSILPGSIPVAYNTAVIFILLGLSLFLSCRNKKNLCFLPVLLACSIVGLTALEYITGQKLFIDELFFKTPNLTNVLHPGRLAPNTDLSLGLIGLSQFLLLKIRPSKWISFLTLFSGQLACAIGLLSLLGYCLRIESSYHWVNLTPMALGTAIGVIILSVGVIAAGFKQNSKQGGQLAYRAEILICSLGLFLTFSFWLAFEKQEEIQLKQLTQHRLLNLEVQLTEKLSARFKALDRVAARWAYSNGSNYGAWNDDVKYYLADQPDYTSIEWIDETHHTRWIYSRENTESHIEPSISNQKLNSLFKKALEIGRGLPSPVFTSANGKKEILYISPIRNRNGQFEGFISGTYKLDELLKSVVASANFKISIFENGQLIYGKQGDKSSPVSVKKSFERFGLKWHLQVNPSDLLANEIESPLADVLLFNPIVSMAKATTFNGPFFFI